MKLRGILISLLLLSLVLLCGCGGDSGKPPVTPERKLASESQEAPPSEASPSEEEPEPIYITFEGTDLEWNPVSQDIFLQSK